MNENLKEEFLVDKTQASGDSVQLSVSAEFGGEKWVCKLEEKVPEADVSGEYVLR